MRGSSTRAAAAAALVVALVAALAGPTAPGAHAIVRGQPGSQIYFAASVQDRAGGHFCGGSLIDPSWVLTAKHCLQGRAIETVQLRTGTPHHNSGGTLHVPVLIRHHPSADLALVRLGGTSSGRPVPIAAASPPVGTRTLILGWGSTCVNTWCASAVVHELPTSVLSDGACAADVTTICTDNPYGGGNCVGDDGSPQVQGSTSSWELVGTALRPSFPTCGSAPSTYLDVTAFRGWINSMTGIGS
ncbi:S1 family peptidase [Saccharothrix xinjiangensis]|uniref:S1 family peptidase n=1 Tax=Saccharothrix xinjiangensis TaxID=204798 RepID=A0ABV9XYW3_9PSEU